MLELCRCCLAQAAHLVREPYRWRNQHLRWGRNPAEAGHVMEDVQCKGKAGKKSVTGPQVLEQLI